MLNHEPLRQARQGWESRASTGPEPAHTTEVATAPQTGVTADEIARAIAAIEGRRRAGEGRHADAALVGAVLDEMGLEGVTPAEVLTEVEAQRRAATEGRERAMHEAARRRSHLKQNLAVAVAVVAGVALAVGGIARERQISAAVPSAGVGTAGTTTVTPAAVAAPPVYTPQTVVRDQGPDGPVLRTLAEVPDGRPVRAHLGQEVWNEKVVLKVKNFVPGAEQQQWTVVKFGGRAYLRAYAAPASDAALAAGELMVWSEPGVQGGLPTAPVNVPLDALRGSSVFYNSLLRLENVRFDGRLRDPVPVEPAGDTLR